MVRRDVGKKRVLVTYGVDVDAVAGWLGSYGGEDSTSDISRGMLLFDCISLAERVVLLHGKRRLTVAMNRCLGGHGGNPTSTKVLQEVQCQSDLVYPRTLSGDVPRGDGSCS